MTPRLAAASRSGHRAARHGAVLVFHPGGGDAPGHPLRGASVRWRGPIRQPAPAAGPNKASPPPGASRTAKNRPAGMGGGVRRPGNGTKRVRIGEASGFAHRSFRPDAVHHMYATTATRRPAVTHPDTWRDEKETARRAAFPQPGGRFRRWWQVLGSNQRRLSRRFYSPLPPPESYAIDLRLCVTRRDFGSPPSAMCPCAPGSGGRAAHGRPRTAGWERLS